MNHIKAKTVGIILIMLILSACVSIPKETVTLSQILGSDLQILHNSHQRMVSIYYSKIKDDINTFIDDVYAPYIIHYVLKRELKAHKEGKPSLYGTIEFAGEDGGKEATEAAVNEMFNFQVSARKQIEKKRREILLPIENQEAYIMQAINQSYNNAIYANSTITGYLKSTRKLKEAQSEALSMVGLSGTDTLITNSLIRVSEQVGQAVKLGKEIDVKSDDAYEQLEEITKQIKEITNKK